jgi:hypothetical protein
VERTALRHLVLPARVIYGPASSTWAPLCVAGSGDTGSGRLCVACWIQVRARDRQRPCKATLKVAGGCASSVVGDSVGGLLIHGAVARLPPFREEHVRLAAALLVGAARRGTDLVAEAGRGYYVGPCCLSRWWNNFRSLPSLSVYSVVGVGVVKIAFTW